jgi:hypothetical protein
MFAKKCVFFLWGVALSSLWWAKLTVVTDSAFWIPVGFLTVLSGLGFAFHVCQHWNDGEK